MLDHLLYEGNYLFLIALVIFDDDSTEETYIFLPVKAIRKLLQKLFITSDYGQLDHILPPCKIYIAGVPSAKLNPQKKLSLRTDRLIYA